MRSVPFGFLFLVAAAVACGDLVDDPPLGGSGGTQTDSGAGPGTTLDGSPATGDDASTGDDDDQSDGQAAPDATGDDAPSAPDADAGIPVGATIGSCDRTKWTVSASDSHPVSPPGYAVDFLPPTRWSSGLPQAPGQYFQVDFGGYVVLDQITLDDSYGPSDHADYPRAFNLLGSADGTTFPTTLTAQSFGTDPGAIVTASFAPQATRAVRIQVTSSSTSWWSMHELTFGCTTPNGPDDSGAPVPYDGGDVSASSGLPHTGWTATASSIGNSDVAANAIDGNATTRWSSGKAQYGDEWLRVDLGQSTNISQVWLTSNATDFSAAYAFEVSSDDLTYTPVTTGLGSALTKIEFPRRAARYVRIRQIGSDDVQWWSVYEITVIP